MKRVGTAAPDVMLSRRQVVIHVDKKSRSFTARAIRNIVIDADDDDEPQTDRQGV